MTGCTTTPYDELRALAVQNLERAGVSSQDALLVADTLCAADLMGIDTHGTKRSGLAHRDSPASMLSSILR